jgi:hypothetical protein
VIKQQNDAGKLSDAENNVFENRVDSKLKSLENKIEGIEDKLDMILRKMTTAGN